jgi:hypothetical protein
MFVILAKVVGYALQILTGLPSIVTGVENLWQHIPKSGAQKWIAVEQALSGTISTIGSDVAKDVPNITADDVATAMAKFSKAANDAFVELLNDLGLFKSATPAASAPAATAPTS